MKTLSFKFLVIIFSIFFLADMAMSVPKGIVTFETSVLEQNKFEVRIYLQRTVDSDYWKLGGSSFFFYFNKYALTFDAITDYGNWSTSPYMLPFSSENLEASIRTFDITLLTIGQGFEVPVTKTLVGKLRFNITDPNAYPNILWAPYPLSAIFTDDLETQVTDLVINNPNNVPLPVSLASFTSAVFKNTVNLDWKTAMEVNNKEFRIERKMNTTSEWSQIATVEGKGNSDIPVEYSYSDKNLQTGKYSYRLKQIDNNGNFEYFTLNSDVIVGVPTKFDLSQNYPNPFNPSTKINFDLPNDAKVSMKLYDMLGREVAILLNEFRTAGYYTLQFDATSLSSGIYFYRISAGSYSAIKKMVLIK